MNTHIISKAPADPDWSSIPSLPIDQLLWTESTDITAQAQICYDSDALHVRLSAQEAHIRAEHTGVLGMPCEDSCLEFFFSPICGDTRYLNFEFNPNGCVPGHRQRHPRPGTPSAGGGSTVPAPAPAHRQRLGNHLPHSHGIHPAVLPRLHRRPRRFHARQLFQVRRPDAPAPFSGLEPGHQ